MISMIVFYNVLNLLSLAFYLCLFEVYELIRLERLVLYKDE